MSQAGRGLNGGGVGSFFVLSFIDRLYNASETFFVDNEGNVTCNTLDSKGPVTASNFIQVTDSGDVDLEEQIVEIQGEIAIINSEIATIDSEISTINTEIVNINTELSLLSSRPYVNAYAFATYVTSYTIVSFFNLTLTFASPGVIYVDVTSKPPQYLGYITVTLDITTPAIATTQIGVGHDFTLFFFDLGGLPIDSGFQILIT